MRRHHVQLSPDEGTAQRVGARRGRPVVLAVDTRAMRRDLVHGFYRTQNGVWLVERVPPRGASNVFEGCWVEEAGAARGRPSKTGWGRPFYVDRPHCFLMRCYW